MKEEGEGCCGNFTVATDHGVPHEGVGMRNAAEETVSVVDVAGVGDGAECEESAEGERVSDETGESHACLNLS